MVHLQLTDEQTMLRHTAREFLAQACPPAARIAARSDPRECAESLWRGMAELGWMGLVIPEEYGGVGGSFMDLAVLLEEMGRVCLPGTYFSTAVLGALCLLELTGEGERTELLPQVARGALKLAVVLKEGGASLDAASGGLRVIPTAGGCVLRGEELFVADAAAADLLLCIAGEAAGAHEACSLVIVPRGDPCVRLTPMPNIAGAQQYAVAIDDLPLQAEMPVGAGPHGHARVTQMLLEAAVAKCAEMVGGAQRVLDLAVAHAREREQFGRPIGSFQAVQHHCVNMLMDLECARWLTYKSASAIDRKALRPDQAAKTKAWCNQAYRRIVQLGHQVIGGVGYCEEHEMPLFFRHARVAEVMLGDCDTHLEVLAEGLLGRRAGDARSTPA